MERVDDQVYRTKRPCHQAPRATCRIRKGGKFTPVPNTDFELDVDLVLLAMGFTGPVKNGLLDSLGVDYDARGCGVNDLFMTNVEGVFAGGDTKRGASLIVWAIAEGRKMAAGIDKYLQTNRSAKKSVA